MDIDFYYRGIFILTMLITAWAALAVWRRHSAPGALALFWMMIAILEWNFCGLMEASSTDLASNAFWSQIAYFGSWTAQPLFLIFVLGYTHQQKWVTRRNVGLLFIMPIITIALAQTNPLHHLIWTGFLTNPDGYVTYQHGVWFWISVVYINAILLLGTGLLFHFSRHTRELYRYQNVGLVIASLFPWAGFSLYVSPFNPFPGLDITAISFAVTGAILVYIISRLSFLDIIPVAREFLVDNMLDGLLVLDLFNRAIDINAAALRILGLRPGQKWIGLPLHDLLPPDSGLEEMIESENKLEMEWEENGPAPRSYDLQVLPLYQRPTQLSGRAIIFRDISHRKEIERALWQANQELEERLRQIETLQEEMREQSIRDALTGLFNRRYIEEIFAHEVSRAQREAHPLSIIILDLDHFKEINDQFGHSCGDDALRAMGAALQTHFRGGDIACRYGGDEFMLIMPDSAAGDAFRRIEVFRQVCTDLLHEYASGLPPVTFSAGVASYPVHAETTPELVRIADQTLYRAKAQGRNRTLMPR